MDEDLRSLIQNYPESCNQFEHLERWSGDMSLEQSVFEWALSFKCKEKDKCNAEDRELDQSKN